MYKNKNIQEYTINSNTHQHILRFQQELTGISNNTSKYSFLCNYLYLISMLMYYLYISGHYNLQNNARTKFTSSIVLISTLTNVILITDQTMIRNTKFKNLEFRFSVTSECFHFH